MDISRTVKWAEKDMKGILSSCASFCPYNSSTIVCGSLSQAKLSHSYRPYDCSLIPVSGCTFDMLLFSPSFTSLVKLLQKILCRSRAKTKRMECRSSRNILMKMRSKKLIYFK